MATTDDGFERIAADEILYRRVTERSGWYAPESDKPIAWEAFRPNEKDVRGLSVWRAKYKSPEQAALQNARQNRRYFILEIEVASLRRLGVEVAPDPFEGDPGHAALTTLRSTAYQEDKNRIRGLAERIATELVQKVYGPFDPATTRATG